MTVVEPIAPVTNGGAPDIEFEEPYGVILTAQGVSPLLFHAWNNEAVLEKARARKNSKAKKTDNIESYVYRCEDGTLGIPGPNLHASVQQAAKFRQDPRSPRKSAFDLYKAAVTPMTEIASLGVEPWDYIDRRRVMVQRAGITRERPAMRAGWEATFEFAVTLPEYVRPIDFHDILNLAGRVIGLLDFRPTYGRFNITRFEVVTF